MKKLIFVLMIGSILTAQPQAFKQRFAPNKIPSSQDIHQMVLDKVMNRSTSQLDAQTGRRTIDVMQTWNGSAWENSKMTEYVYAPAKIKAGQFPSPDLGLILINYFLWSSGAWSANGYDEWSYDGQGNLIQIMWYNYGIAYGKTTYSGPYVNGHSSGMIYQYYNNGVWTNSMRYTYTYDTNGCMIDEVWELWNGSAWEYFYRKQYYYSQACCPDRWVFSNWENNAWVINYMAAFTYAYANCMTDLVPFADLWYLCNPTLVLMGPSTDGTNMTTVDWRDEYTYTNCLAMTYLMYYMGVLQSTTGYGWNTLPSKVSSTYDNSNQRLTSQVTQTNGVNSTRTWYSYEGLTLSAESEAGIPTDFSLKQNYPNPFNPSTTITFDISEEANVKILIYDMTGRLIRELVDQTMTVGSKTINWDGKDDTGNPVSGGVYLYNLQTGDYSQTKKMVLLR